MDNQTPTDPASFKRIYSLIFLSMAISPLIYGVVVKFAGASQTGGAVETLFFPLAGVSIILGVTAVFLRSRILQYDSTIGYNEAQGKLSSMFIVILALFESIAIFGVVLAFLGGGLKMYLNFGVPSLALLLSQYPLLGQLTEKLEEIHRRNPPEE